MRELLRSNDLVHLSWAQAMLAAEGIASVLLDDYVSGVEGSIGAIPRRLMVAEEALRPGRAGARARRPRRSVIDDLTLDRLLGGRVRSASPRAAIGSRSIRCSWRPRYRRLRGRAGAGCRRRHRGGGLVPGRARARLPGRGDRAAARAAPHRRPQRRAERSRRVGRDAGGRSGPAAAALALGASIT